MYRLSESLAKEIMSKIKTPEIESSGSNAFLPKNYFSVGIADPICCVGSDYEYLLESPVPVIYPELPYVPVGVQAYFLYRRDELKRVDEPWEVQEVFINPTCTDPEKRIDCKDAAVQLPNDIEKLTAITVTSMGQLIGKEPLLLDALNLDQK